MKTILTITGPTCSGKSTLEKDLGKTFQYPKLTSITTRKQRQGEVNGKDYYFLTTAAFESLMTDNKLVEMTQVSDKYYGITTEELNTKLNNDDTVVVVVEPAGLRQISEYCKLNNLRHISVFLEVPSKLQATRFLRRSTKDQVILDFDATINRLAMMLHEEHSWKSCFDYTLVFDVYDGVSSREVLLKIRDELILR